MCLEVREFEIENASFKSEDALLEKYHIFLVSYTALGIHFSKDYVSLGCEERRT